MKTNKNWQNSEVKNLFKTIILIKDAKEAAKFFRDLCTLEEIKEMAGRWQAAKMINQGKSYREISVKTGLSTATVTRVAQWLNYGEGGYQLLLKKSEKNPTKSLRLNNHHKINSPQSR